MHPAAQVVKDLRKARYLKRTKLGALTLRKPTLRCGLDAVPETSSAQTSGHSHAPRCAAAKNCRSLVCGASTWCDELEFLVPLPATPTRDPSLLWQQTVARSRTSRIPHWSGFTRGADAFKSAPLALTFRSGLRAFFGVGAWDRTERGLHKIF